MRALGLRRRVTALAAVTVGVALIIGAFLLVSVLRNRLDDAASTAAVSRARDVGALAEVGVLPRQLALPGEESAFVQVVDADGRVVASTENIEGEGVVVSTQPTGSGLVLVTTGIEPLNDSDEMRVAVVNASTSEGVVTVYAGESLQDVAATTAAVVAFLLLGIPVLMLLVAMVAWWAVGRTLRPVREITRTMSEITTSDLHRRVPVPEVLDEIGELATTVNETLERLDFSVDRQRTFVADASHELRGPLAALRADLEISITHPDQTSWVAVARDTLGDVERLQHLTNDLLLLARLDSRHARERQRVDVAAVASEAIELVRRDDLTVTTTGLDTPTMIDGDSEQLQRMMRNLVHNAEVHADVCIAVGVATEDRSVVVTVSDDGAGIRPEERQRVFERFVRLDSARTRSTGGTGLGLAIVTDVVANHGGDVNITDDELGGARFVIRLPSAGTATKSLDVTAHSPVER